MTTYTTKNNFAKSEAADLYSVTRTGLNANWDLIDDAIQLSKWDAAIDPTGTDDTTLGYAIGSIWYNEADNFLWVCTDATEDNALWVKYYNNDSLGALTVDWDAGGYEIKTLKFESDVATGTAPFACASTTVCTNLNADTVDGKHNTDLAQLAGASGGQTLKGGTGASENLTLMSTNHGTKGKVTTADQIESTLATGTSPFAVSSITVNTNLNADLLDGSHAAAYVTHALSTAENDFLVGGVGGTANTFVKKTLAETKTILAHTHADFRIATLLIGDGVNVITTGVKGGFCCPITGHITGATMASLDATAGAIAVACWVEPYAGGVPINDDEVDIFSIAATGTQSQEGSLTIDVTVGDWINFNVDSCTSLKLVGLALNLETV